MCGFYLFEPGHDFYNRFNIQNRLDFLPKKINVTPGRVVPVIWQAKERIVQSMEWGLIPFWAKDRNIGKKMFNARSESILEKPAFKKAYKTQRCLIPSNGFYEWKKENNKNVLYFIKVIKRPIFAFAGLYDIWKDTISGKKIYSYTIITTQANEKVKLIHDRMPVILEKKDEDFWLDQFSSIDSLKTILHPSEEILDIKSQ